VSKKPTEIICKPSGWFIWRAVLISLMFLGFAGFFYYDGKIGYKKKNVDFYQYSAKSRAKEFFKQAAVERGNNDGVSNSPASSEERWTAFAKDYEVELFEKRDVRTEESAIKDITGCLPKDFEFPQKLPEVFVTSFSEMSADVANIETIWKKHAADSNISESSGEYFKSKSEIESQFNWAIGSAVLGCIALFFLFRTLTRSMKVDENGYTAPGGKFVDFDSIFKIDKRKWSRKGISYLYYKESEASDEKKARIDGMVYGQFDMENPNNAEALYQRIEANVKNVEIIDYEADEDDEGEVDEKLLDAVKKGDSE